MKTIDPSTLPLEQADRAYSSAQQFLLLAKRFWTTELHGSLRAKFDTGDMAIEKRQPDRERDSARVDGPDEVPVEPGVNADANVQASVDIFKWLERHLQRQKYAGRYGLQAWLARDRDEHQTWLTREAEVATEAGRLALNPNCPVPAPFASVDIHQHPGGVWQDPLAGLVYERGARTTTPLAGERHLDLHERLARMLEADHPSGHQLIDLGCGFGKSTRAIYQLLPKCQVVAVDVAAPCLVLGAAQANEDAADNIQYRQADARHCGEPAQSADLVTSTMLLHEMPAADLPALFAECWRVLRPGGTMRHLDFLPSVQPRNDAFLQWSHLGHAKRNNEAFMAELLAVDLPAMLA
ncbi:MAG: class I SAM-dependent methyltransferase, partial [Burkholderiaceae bacterium]